MSTRLDRLFLLLDTGSTPVIRKTAAEQLGDVQKLHPHELNNLLSKVHTYLCSPTWETRVAAGQAVDAIAHNVPQWDPKPALKNESVSPPGVGGYLSLAAFDVARVLTRGASLLASEGREYEDEDLVLEDKERLARHKHLLNKRLGLDVAGGMGVDADQLYREEDLVTNVTGRAEEQMDTSSVADLLHQQTRRAPTDPLSVRERNRAKRKAKLLAKQTSKDNDQRNGESDGESAAKLRKTTSQEPHSDEKLVLDNVSEASSAAEELEDWPFEAFCEVLMGDLFHSSWERRHGAAVGLREVMRRHGDGAGRGVDLSHDQMQHLHQVFLEDVAVRLICVLALDRFGDYISDEVVAPVRESCAQTLGVTVQGLTLPGVEAMVRVLMQLMVQPQWEVRHGGLLGLKYLLAVRKDQCASVLPLVLPAVFSGLQDRDDDVRAVAAAALLPVTDILVTTQPQHVSRITQCLWHTLLDLDDLTASTNSIMTLLSTLLANPTVAGDSSSLASLTDLVPRLWPFLSHNILSVRRAALDTIYTLLGRCQDATVGGPLWVLPILQDALRHLYQRGLLEGSDELLDLLCKVWSLLVASMPTDHLVAAAAPWVGIWLCLMMQPASLPFDPTLLIEAKHAPRELTPSRARHAAEAEAAEQKDQRLYLGGAASQGCSPLHQDRVVIRARKTAARLLGQLCCYITRPLSVTPEGVETPTEALAKLLVFHLSSKSAIQRVVIGIVIIEWAKATKSCQCPVMVKSRLHDALSEPIYYDEIALSFTRMQTECKDFIASLRQHKVDMDQHYAQGSILTLEQAQALCGSVFEAVSSTLKPKALKALEDRRKQLLGLIETTNMEQLSLTMRVQSCLAGAVTWVASLPEKMNPVVRPLMDVIKREQNHQLQLQAAEDLSQLAAVCVDRTPNPTPKIVRNVCGTLCADPSFTPAVGSEGPSLSSDLPKEANCDKHSGILTLYAQQVTLETGRGRKATVFKKAPSISTQISLDTIAKEEDETKKQLLIQRRGATLTLQTIAKNSGAALVDKVPQLWETLTESLRKVDDLDLGSEAVRTDVEFAQTLVNSLQVLEVCGPSLHSALHDKLLSSLPSLCRCLDYPFTAVRHMAARCLGSLSKVVTTATMNHVLETVLPNLGDTENRTRRQGTIEALSNLIDQMGVLVVPYIVLLVVPIMGRMSDLDTPVRLMATHCFATLVRLMPLESSVPDPPAMKEALVRRKEEERRFLEQLMDSSKLEPYRVCVPIEAELRQYQQDGINWLAFLNKYKLHGILCDDMGLGKTLQSICILASDHKYRADKYKVAKSPDCAPLPSIVVCPPTLTGHWVYEIEKFVAPAYLNPLHYHGPPIERQKLQKRVKKHNLVVASYDVVRNDIDFFGKINWNYCILDEGHIIKNSKTKISRAVKQLSCAHRVILSGTPIQNNVLELWSLFDFLMPGLLGSERQFTARYGKPILQSRDAKSSTKEQEAGALAMEALHRQALPFLLRRLKEDVLKDLPPKIIQDYYCDLSPLQVKLYEDFAKSRAKRTLDETVNDADKKEKKVSNTGTNHIFQALQYLRKVCNHPALVMTPQHPQYEAVCEDLRRDGSSLKDIQHAPKLMALKQLLLDCGIGVPASDSADTPVVNQHRVLLFCQLKSMVNIVETELLKAQMPSVTYLRLDGSVPPGNRHSIVNRFNTDPSIDVLLLTTHVGGLGLNLTGADTVIFVEHDWNPMKDLQAMDRAHRIGQKKVVTVYRLVTRGTLEEKIMGLQKFKLKIANTIITQDNSSLSSMGTDQLLDLFSLEETSKGKAVDASAPDASSPQKTSMKAILDNLEDLWDEKQYESEYNMDTFMKTLSKQTS